MYYKIAQITRPQQTTPKGTAQVSALNSPVGAGTGLLLLLSN